MRLFSTISLFADQVSTNILITAKQTVNIADLVPEVCKKIIG